MGLFNTTPEMNENLKVEELLKDMKWSYSRFSSYEKCKRLFYYKYIEKRPTPSSLPMRVGKIVHLALDIYIRQMLSAKESLQAAIFEIGELPESETFSSLLKLVENGRFLVPSNRNFTIQSEVDVKVRTAYGVFHAIIDLVAEDLLNDELILCDFKTGWQETNAADSIQLKLYAWIYRAIRGGSCPSTVKIRLVFPRLKKISEHEMTESDFAEAQAYFLRHLKAITATERWEGTTDTSKCEYCPFVGLCAAGVDVNNFPRQGEFANVQEAQRVGEFILYQETYIKSLKKSLRSYVDKNGTISSEKGSWVIQQSEPTPKITARKEWLNFITELELDPSDFIDAKVSKIEELLEFDEEGKLKQLIEYTAPRKTLKYIEEEKSVQ